MTPAVTRWRSSACARLTQYVCVQISARHVACDDNAHHVAVEVATQRMRIQCEPFRQIHVQWPLYR